MTEITVNNNGSVLISGEFIIKDQNGNAFDLGGRTMIKLCRCGHSGNKPFCDGTHNKIGFQSVIEARALPPLAPKA